MSAGSPGETASPSGAASSALVLAVEAREDTRAIHVRLLHEAGFRAQRAADGMRTTLGRMPDPPCVS